MITGNLSDIDNILKFHAKAGSSKVKGWFKVTNLRHDYFHFSAIYSLAAKVVAPNKPNYEDDIRMRVTHDG